MVRGSIDWKQINHLLHEFCVPSIYSCADSVVCWLMHCRLDPNQGRTTLWCLYVVVRGSYRFAALPWAFIYLCWSYQSEWCSLLLLCLCIDHRHWFHWTAVWFSCISLSIACSVLKKQRKIVVQFICYVTIIARDLALPVGYLAWEDFSLLYYKWIMTTKLAAYIKLFIVDSHYISIHKSTKLAQLIK